MANVKLIAVGVAAIIVIAAIGFVFLGGDDGSDGIDFNKEAKFCLDVYGNANEDLVIDQKDLDLINKIISKEEKFEDWPMADADYNNEIDKDDVALVESIISGKSDSVNIVCLDKAGKDKVVSVPYPLTNTVAYGTNMTVPFVTAGGLNGNAGVGYFIEETGGSYKDANSLLLNSDLTMLGLDSSRQMDSDAWQAFQELDTKVGINALLIDHSVGALDNGAYRSDLAAAGIPEVRLAVADGESEINSILLMGFLFGGDSAKAGHDYAVLGQKVYNEIREKTSSLDNKDKQTYIALNMGCYICETNSTYNLTPAYVNGVPYYATNDEFAKLYAGTSSTKMQNAETLSNFDNADKLFSFRSYDYDTTASEIKENQWDKYKSYFETLDSYENLVYVNNILPSIIKMAYIGNTLYPSLISESYIESVFADVVELVPSMNGYTVDNTVVVYTYEDYTKGA